MKKLLIKNYIKKNYIENYIKDILKNDFINCQLYLKTTRNFLYDSSYFLLFEKLKENKFKYYLNNILLYKLIDAFLLLLLNNDHNNHH